ncbi:MAG: hypothetical protein MPN21_19105 [Thermoanaerobaculia bacterium]|nr:hypothetical protein [Thermoanaerobaculia bacterium]
MKRGSLKEFPLLCLLVAVLPALGCAFGNTHTFDYRPRAPVSVGEGAVVILFSVADRRPDIVAGDEPPEWVGEQRGGYGNPFNVKTTSGKPFSAIVAETVRRDLEAAGFDAVLVDESASANSVGETIRSRGAQRGVAVVMHKFNSNTYVNIDVEWDFEVTVLDANGEAIGSNRETGKETLEGSFMNPPKAAKEKVPPFFYDIVHRLVVGNEEIREALTVSR